MKKLMAANWKLFKTPAEAADTAKELAKALDGKMSGDREALIFPNFVSIPAVAQELAGKTGMHLGGQNFYHEQSGAFTGETAPEMLRAAGCEFGLVGHSERRHVFGESNETIGKKTAFGLENGLKVVLCVGELLEEREAGKVEAVLTEQLQKGLAGVSSLADPALLTIAYEPVWAIGTGKVAGPDDIVDAHATVRRLLGEILPGPGASMRILYGGSVKPDNASEIITLDNVDGVLVGGASLQADSFSKIVLA